MAVDLAPPKFNAIHKNVTVSVGQTAVLPCTVKSLGSFKIVWVNPDEKTLTFEDRRITGDERVSLERPYVNEWNLHVREVEMKDSGVYLCQINTKPVQVRPVQLIVQQPSIILDRLSSAEVVKVIEGETVQLVCNVTGFPAPEVTWLRLPKGASSDQDDKKNIGAKGEVLMIHNVSRYCDDDYECVAFNGVQPADKRRMRVRVQFQPEVRLPNKKLAQVQGRYTILDCKVTAFPLTVTSWRRNGVEIDNDKKFTTEVYPEGDNSISLTLTINSLTPDDYGDYECYSENFLGFDRQFMTLFEYVKKTTPKPTTTTTTTTTTARWHGIYHGNHGNNDGGHAYNGYNNGGDAADIDPYSSHNNGRESQHLRKNNHNTNEDGGNNRDGSVQSVISDPESSSPRGNQAVVTVILLAALTSILCILMMR